jgi:uncharacterized membrane protein
MLSRPSYRALVWVCVFSLSANVFLIGFAAARLLGPGFRHGPPSSESTREGKRPFFKGMDPELRSALGERLRATAPQRVKLRETRDQLRRLLQQDPFDASAFDAALAELRAHGVATQTALHEQLSKLARESTPEQRRRLADSKWFKGRASGDRM